MPNPIASMPANGSTIHAPAKANPAAMESATAPKLAHRTSALDGDIEQLRLSFRVKAGFDAAVCTIEVYRHPRAGPRTKTGRPSKNLVKLTH